MTATRPISRFKAASIHLLISTAIAATALAVMLMLWYPPPLFQAMGGMELAILIVGVDVAIGPLITLIVFDTKKKELLFDLAVIAALQLAALTYGVYAMHAGRPVFVVFVEDRFITVSAAELEKGAVVKAKQPEFRSLSVTGPRWVAAETPSDPKDVEEILFARLAGLGAQNLPQHYASYDDRRSEILARSRPIDRLNEISQEEGVLMEKALVRAGRTREQVNFLPVITKRRPLTALIDNSSGALIEVVAVDPSSAWRPFKGHQ